MKSDWLKMSGHATTHITLNSDHTTVGYIGSSNE